MDLNQLYKALTENMQSLNRGDLVGIHDEYLVYKDHLNEVEVAARIKDACIAAYGALASWECIHSYADPDAVSQTLPVTVLRLVFSGVGSTERH